MLAKFKEKGEPRVSIPNWNDLETRIGSAIKLT